MDVDTQNFAHALEDLPEEARHQAAGIAGIAGTVGIAGVAAIAGSQPVISLRERIRDEIENVALGSYGNLERTPLLHFLSYYRVTPYTYQVSPLAARGQRPDAEKLAALALLGYGATINLCAEIPDGDGPAIAKAGLAEVLRTSHIPIIDMESPTIAQVTEIFDLLSGSGAELTYVHCEAGRGRTGVVIACYRMAVMGWSFPDALTEAVNFGCCVPKQLAFIREFSAMLRAGSATGRYPLLPLGSVAATPAQLAATIHTTAEQESVSITQSTTP